MSGSNRVYAPEDPPVSLLQAYCRIPMSSINSHVFRLVKAEQRIPSINSLILLRIESILESLRRLKFRNGGSMSYEDINITSNMALVTKAESLKLMTQQIGEVVWKSCIIN